MAATVQQLPSCGIAIDPSPRHPDFSYALGREPLWTDSWSHGDLRSQDHLSADSVVASLIACIRNKDLARGTTIHDDLAQHGLLKRYSDALVTMYAKCGELGKAKAVLDQHKSGDAIAWTTLISGYVRKGQAQNALNSLEKMQLEGVLPNAVAYVSALKACAIIRAAAKGKQIHDEIVRQGLLQNNVALGGALVDMYCKCGDVSEARRVLQELPCRNVISWNALVAGYVQEGEAEQALNCLELMQHEGIFPDAVTYACALKACARIKASGMGKQIHEEIVRQGLLQNDVVLGNVLMDMYCKCGNLSEAQQVLKKLTSRDVISWNTIIAGYTQEGEAEQALFCLEQMQREGILPDSVTHTCALKACATIKEVSKGKQIHEEIARQGLLQNNAVLGCALVDVYAKSGDVSEARRVLLELPSRNVTSWNALIAGYTQEGEAEHALKCLEEMQHEGIFPDVVTYMCVLKACASIKAALRGIQIHQEIVRQGLLQNNVALGGALVDMYAKCGNIFDARRVLQEYPCQNVVAWSALIAGCVQQGEAEQALDCLEQMWREGIHPDAVTYACTLQACAVMKAVDRGKQIHKEIVRQGLLWNHIMLGNTLVDMYAKCGDVSTGRRVLEELPSRNVVTWSTLIAGYVQEGEADQALDCLEQMQQEGILPDAITYACALRACATIRAVRRGKHIHEEIVRQGLLQNNLILGNVLVEMYAKCGHVTEARRVLEELPFRNVVSWSVLIAGYAQEGEAEEALNCLEQMQHEGILPDVVTFACILNVCNHHGLLEDAQELFFNMSTKFGVKPNLECYTCMIDLFGRSGHLEKAARLIQEMPSSDHTMIWHAMLDACRKQADVTMGEWAFEQAVKLDKSDRSAYMLMANVYAAVGVEGKAKSMEAMRMRNMT
ncbi:hypothetical protein GOP47_0024165 [Adiantum capillus-veneris]|uniref:Pentatricopeptide repeat-containing protein n=1 Tax=Adiantum capillus-veneris TaxID=13818 RepID=A0A9D4Z5A7_ADICA|nr:hypothetical protein GOP47_0024165 [Adiantum capillus-veneris]